MRADEIIKQDYYKAAAMKMFISQSKFPSTQEIEQFMSSVNLMESLFKTALVANGELFNAKLQNSQFEAIDKDLRILYQLLLHYAQEEYNSLSQFADTTLTALEKKTDFYLTKSKLEMQSSDLGKTALFLRAPFSGEQINEFFEIDCGIVQLTNGSIIHLLVEGNNINYARLKLENEKETIFVTPYELNRQSFKMPGDIAQKEIKIEIPSAPKPNESIFIAHQPVEDCDYIILAGKNNIATKMASSSKYVDYSQSSFYEDTMIDFYVKGGTSIQIRTSTRPLNTNYDFGKDVIKLTKDIHHFYLKMPANSAIEIFVEGGDIYAQKAKGVIESGKLYFVHNTPFKEFLLIEKSRANKTDFKATLEVRSTIESLGIESIMIKELI